MDINGFKKTKKREGIIKSESDSLIRTMHNDMIALEKKERSKKVSPPDGLPIVESIRNSDIKVQKEAEEKARKEAEKRKEAEERIIEEAQKRREVERKAREEAEEKAREEAEKQRKIKEREIKKAKRKEKIKQIKIRLLKNAPKLIAGLIIVFLITGIGIFFYWWNYVRIVPVIVTHFECQNEQCIEVEGEGESKCQINENCKPIEPIVPEKLIPSAKIETIELSIEEYELFLNKLESVFAINQEKDTFKIILVKLIKQTEREYADFDSFISISKISIPENIKDMIASSDINGNNYNLFLYNNGEENRVGLIINMGQSFDLVQNLNAWEETIATDINPFIFKDENLEPATEEFQDNIYNGIAIRYLNFPTSDLSVDYAIISDKLIITTSKDSMYAVIDALIN